jgi:hypothetical protein
MPGLSCEREVHRGGRGVYKRVGRARREKGFALNGSKNHQPKEPKEHK